MPRVPNVRLRHARIECENFQSVGLSFPFCLPTTPTPDRRITVALLPHSLPPFPFPSSLPSSWSFPLWLCSLRNCVCVSVSRTVLFLPRVAYAVTLWSLCIHVALLVVSLLSYNFCHHRTAVCSCDMILSFHLDFLF